MSGVMVGKDWTLWRPDNETSIHIDWASGLRIDVVREGENTSKLIIPLPPVEMRYVSVFKHSVLLTLHTDDNDMEVRLYYDGEETTLQLEGMGFLVSAKLKEG